VRCARRRLGLGGLETTDPNVKILDIGLNEWQKSGLPITRQVSIRKKQLTKDVHFKSKINYMIRADADMIRAKQQSMKLVIA
jgi:3-mercaptopyruvate sulfurtransferase SseA